MNDNTISSSYTSLPSTVLLRSPPDSSATLPISSIHIQSGTLMAIGDKEEERQIGGRRKGEKRRVREKNENTKG